MGIVYTLSGKLYDFLDKPFEEKRYYAIRRKFIRPLHGTILDAGCGTGKNFPHYSEKTNIIAVDNAERMLKQARKICKESKAKITIERADLTNLPFKENYFDATVATFVLCVMPRNTEEKALQELVRVTKPKGRLYFLEYVYSKKPGRKFFMKITAWLPRILFGMRYNTTLKAIESNSNLTIINVEYVLEDVLRLVIAEKKI